MKFGLWYAPDRSNDLTNWQRDAGRILDLHQNSGVNYFKIDFVQVTSKTGEKNLHKFYDQVMRESQGRIVLDLDVTAENRSGYFGAVEVGPLFVENRYTDWHRYWPHQTLRNFWSLAQYVDPVRLRIEFLNNTRNSSVYPGDTLAPVYYRPAYLFATTMFASPLGWFEVSNLPEKYVDEVAALVRIWKAHRERIHGGRIVPIGQTPDGTSWTGFASIDEDRRRGYILLFRERHPSSTMDVELPKFGKGEYKVATLAGNGAASLEQGRLKARINDALDFLFLAVTAK